MTYSVIGTFNEEIFNLQLLRGRRGISDTKTHLLLIFLAK